eukprot:CAMPEP_0170548184 /NCGR_PEP_ID=MMETSP0211-20121228/6520_1 /TAXON_ID=311385 /ORGANISM="Pseudokeronopsis sp., Strain OXSARD2" /LENGTH=63 /DNA_ID=CAMNT_0010853597 /DNA_START=3 /DNA_END=194 /DNA_ORIENTATION=+
MIGPKYVDKNLDMAQYRDLCYQKHYQKLDEMQKIEDVKKMAKTVDEKLEKKKIDKNKNIEFLN